MDVGEISYEQKQGHHQPTRRHLMLGSTLAATAIMSGRASGLEVSPRASLRDPFPNAIEGATPSLPSAAVVTLNRAAFGPRPGDVADFVGLGTNGPDRLAAWVTLQLDPDSIPDTELDQRFLEADFDSYGLSDDPDTYLEILWDWYINDNAPPPLSTSTSVPRDEIVRATFMRAMYGRRQLTEVLGNFRDLLEAVTRSTAMLYYLDNYTSSSAGPNENFCRELFELHTLGAENYLGVLQQNQVPVDDQGRPVGFVDADVFEAVRCFTGWSFSYGSGGDGDTGLFYYRSEWHDLFQKTVLGRFIPDHQAELKDGRDVLDELASHPGTGRYIARKLCRRLISDMQPQSLVDSVAALFTAQWQAADQLKQVYEAILLSPEFLATWGEKIKRPFEIVTSALRACDADFTLRMDDSDTSSFLWRYEQTGQELFGWPAPNGYPDVRGAWQSMTPRVMTWRICSWLMDFQNSSDQHYLDVVGQTPGSIRTANELADFWIDRILRRSMESADRDEIVQFMAQGVNPDFDLDLGDEDTRDRLRSMVGVLLMSPDFLWR